MIIIIMIIIIIIISIIIIIMIIIIIIIIVIIIKIILSDVIMCDSQSYCNGNAQGFCNANATDGCPAKIETASCANLNYSMLHFESTVVTEWDLVCNRSYINRFSPCIGPVTNQSAF